LLFEPLCRAVVPTAGRSYRAVQFLCPAPADPIHIPTHSVYYRIIIDFLLLFGSVDLGSSFDNFPLDADS